MNNKYRRTIYTKQDAGAFFMLSLLTPQFIGIFVVIIFLFVSVFSGISFENITDNPIATIFLSLSTQFSFLIVFLLYNKIFRFNYKKANKIYFKNGVRNILIAIIIGLITLYGFQYIVSFFDQLITMWGLPRTDFPLPLNTWYWLIINIVLLAFVPAVCEELVFRGVIFNGLMQYSNLKESKKNRVWIAIIGSALLFSLIHGSIEQTIYPIIFGIVLGILAYKTKSIVPGMIAHFVNNAFVLTMNFLYQTQGVNDSINFGNNFNYYFWGTIIALVSGVIIWLLAKLLTQNKQTVLPETNAEVVFNEQTDQQINEQIIINHDIEALEKSRKQTNVFLWVGVGFGMLFWIVSLFS